MLCVGVWNVVLDAGPLVVSGAGYLAYRYYLVRENILPDTSDEAEDKKMK